MTAFLGDESEETTLDVYPGRYETRRLVRAFGGGQRDEVEWEATMSAIQVVMDRASSSPLWARGRIELRNPNGDLVHEMPSKEE